MNYHTYHTITTHLYSECNLPEDMFLKLKQIVNDEKIPYNNNLAGNIENEYKITTLDNKLLTFLEKNATDFFIKKNNIPDLEHKKIKLKCESLWVNKQKKYEFNPLHNHTGLVSFVCWVQIPYDLNDELNLDNCKNSNAPRNSLFQFAFTGIGGHLHTNLIMIDKTYEGKCIFFDSKTYHQVYPFYTSDDYRISISGNFIMDRVYDQKMSYN